MTSYTAAERLVQITLSNVNITGSLTLTRLAAWQQIELSRHEQSLTYRPSPMISSLLKSQDYGDASVEARGRLSTKKRSG